MRQPEIRWEYPINMDAMVISVYIPGLAMANSRWPRIFLLWQLVRLFYSSLTATIKRGGL